MESEKKYVYAAYNAIFQQDYKRAIECFRKAISCNPRNHSLYYKLSITYARNHQIEEAINAISHALRLNDKSQAYQMHLINLQIRKHVQKAKQAIERGDVTTESVTHLEKWLQVDPNHLEARWTIAMMYLQLGQVAKAEQQLYKIVELDPEHEKTADYFMNRSEYRKDVH